MNHTAIEAGARAASVLIHAENKPTNAKEKQELEAVLESLRAAMRNVQEGSVYQAVCKVLRAHGVAGSTTITRVRPDRRKLLASRIAMAFALEHIRSLAPAQKIVPVAQTGGAL